MAIALSPDGRTLALDLQGSIWTVPVGGGAARRVTDEFNDARQPAWSPDGTTIAFQGFRNGNYDIWGVSPDGTNARTLTDGPFDDREPHFSPDGRYLAFSSDRNGNYDIWTLDLQSKALKALTTSPADDFFPSFSPNSREVAFASNRQEGAGIYAVALESGGERIVAKSDGNLGTPSWSTDGQHVAFSTIAGGAARLIVDGASVSTDEDVFPFRAQWTSASEFLYTADGQIKKRALGGAAPTRIAFTAAIPQSRPAYTRKKRDFNQTAARPVRGIVRPAVSPDGKRVAFAALGDIWIMTIGSAPMRMTNDRFLDGDPAWSPDGKKLAFTTDRGGSVDVWVRDLDRKSDRRLTTAGTSDMLPTWSHDGKQIAFVSINALFTGEIQVVDVQSGAITKVHDNVFGPSEPQWSPDNSRMMFAGLKRYSDRFREGINEFVTFPIAGGADESWTVQPHRGSDVRAGAGPAWSPDGKRVAFVMEGALTVMDVTPDGKPTGTPHRVAEEIAHSPSWTGDSRELVYLSNEKLRRVSADGGTPQDIPLDLTYSPVNPSGTLVVRVGRLVDGTSANEQSNVDIVIEGHRITAIEPQRERPGATIVDGSKLTAMPGLIEMHGHLVKEYGEALGRVLLAYGVTTIRNPAAMTPYMSLEDREAIEAGVRVGPRVFASGYQMDGSRIYYPLGLSITSEPQLEWELERQAKLDLDFIKTYVRLPDLFQKRAIEFGHSHGMPVTSHELYPALGVGIDGTEHTSGTSRRGYSPKISGLQRAYGDVVTLMGKTHFEFTPTASLGGGFRQLTDADPGMLSDPRYQTLFPEWIVKPPAGGRGGGRGGRGAGGGGEPRGAQMALDVLKAGGKVMAGTDSPIGPYGLALQAELENLVAGGMTPLQSLQTATVTAASALNASDDLGSIAVGRLADIVLVDGDPLADIKNALKVRIVIKNGVVHRLEDLLRPTAATTTH